MINELKRITDLLETKNAKTCFMNLLTELCVIAGGSVVYGLGKCGSVVYGLEKCDYKPGDIDCFFNSKEKLLDAYKLVHEHFDIERIEQYKNTNYSFASSIYNLTLKGEKIQFQFILVKYEEVQDIFDYFDMDYVCCAIYNNKLYMTDECRLAHKNNSVNFIKTYRIKTSRFIKSMDKGFKNILIGNYDEEKPTKYKTPYIKYEDLKYKKQENKLKYVSKKDIKIEGFDIYTKIRNSPYGGGFYANYIISPDNIQYLREKYFVNVDIDYISFEIDVKKIIETYENDMSPVTILECDNLDIFSRITKSYKCEYKPKIGINIVFIRPYVDLKRGICGEILGGHKNGIGLNECFTGKKITINFEFLKNIYSCNYFYNINERKWLESNLDPECFNLSYIKSTIEKCEEEINTMKHFMKFSPKKVLLEHYCLINDFEEVKNILNENKIDINNTTCLEYASDNQNLKMCKLLVENGADINKGYFYNSKHVLTKNCDDIEFVKFCLENGVDVNKIYYNLKETILMRVSNVDIAKYLIQKGANIYYKGTMNSVFTKHVIYANIEIVKLLIDLKIDINKEIKSFSPIRLSVDKRSYDLIKLLRENGAEFEIKPNKYKIELHSK